MDSSPGARNTRCSLPPGGQGAGGAAQCATAAGDLRQGKGAAWLASKHRGTASLLHAWDCPCMPACLTCLPACVWPCRSLGVTGSRSCCSRCRATTQRWSDWRGATKSEPGWQCGLMRLLDCEAAWAGGRQRQLPAGLAELGGGTIKGHGRAGQQGFLHTFLQAWGTVSPGCVNEVRVTKQ